MAAACRAIAASADRYARVPTAAAAAAASASIWMTRVRRATCCPQRAGPPHRRPRVRLAPPASREPSASPGAHAQSQHACFARPARFVREIKDSANITGSRMAFTTRGCMLPPPARARPRSYHPTSCRVLGSWNLLGSAGSDLQTAEKSIRWADGTSLESGEEQRNQQQSSLLFHTHHLRRCALSVVTSTCLVMARRLSGARSYYSPTP